MQRPPPEELEKLRAYYEARVESLVREMAMFHLVLRVDQEPLQPLAIGNYVTKVEVRPRLDRHIPAP